MAEERVIHPPALYGRAVELAELRTSLERSRTGQNPGVQITGEAGVGRTSVLHAAITQARDDGFKVGFANVRPFHRPLPLAAARLVMGSLQAHCDQEDQDGYATAFEPLGSMLTDEPPSPAELTEERIRAVLGLFAKVVRNVARVSPVLVAVDNLTWADQYSQRWLANLTGSSAVLPVAVIASASKDASMADHESVPDLGLDRLELRGLDVEAVAEYVESAGLALDDRAIRAFAEVTGGIPFLLREVVRYLTGCGLVDAARIRAAAPQTISEELHLRLRQVDPASIELVRAVAILGDESELPLTARVAGLKFADALSAADRLVGARVLRNSHPLSFVYPVVANAIRDNLPVGARVAGHLAAAQGLREAERGSEQVAEHLVAAGPADLDWAAEALREAATKLSQQGEHERAVVLLQHAMRERIPSGLRPKLLREMGIAETNVAPGCAAGHFSAALRESSDPEQRAEISSRLVSVLVRTGRHADALRALTDALGDLAPDSRYRWPLEAVRAEIALRELSSVSGVWDWLALLDEHDENPVVRQVRAGLSALLVAHRGEDRAEAVRWARQVCGQGGPARLQMSLWCGVLALIYADELELADSFVDEAASSLDISGPLQVATVLHARGAVSARRGHLVKAVDQLRQSMDVALGGGATREYLGVRACAGHLTCALVDLGELGEAGEVIKQFGLDGVLPQRWDSGYALYARAKLRVAQGDVEAGLEDFLSCGRLLEAFDVHNPEIVPWRAGLALANRRLGRKKHAISLAEENLRQSRLWGAQRTVGSALTTFALCHEGDQRVALLREAIDLLETTSARGKLMIALSRLGQALQRQGHGREAAGHLVRAADIAKSVGAVALANRISDLVAPDELAAVSTVSGLLTPQEARITALARLGRTNRQISEELHLTQRTVEFHLSGAYRKLGITGRGQLKAALERLEGS